MIEIGSFEGRSSVWFADQLSPTGRLYCIDSWLGGEEISRTNLNFDMSRIRQNFIHNINIHPKTDRIRVHVSDSRIALSNLMSALHSNVDFIYVDGSHTQCDTLFDVVLSWQLLKKGGVMIVDDYLNEMATNDPLLRPKHAVDFVVKSLGNGVEFMVTKERQAVLRKTK